MTRLVMKFGGTSVANTQLIKKAAEKVAKEYHAGHEVAVVVSAMAGITNQLIGYCHEISMAHDPYEYDVVVSSGEQVTAGLMAIALNDLGVPARSWMGWQVPIFCDDRHGDSRIQNIQSDNIISRFEQKEIAVLAGFQGVSETNRLTTLGRGGSDTSAVAFAAAINAQRCDIYTDVDGIYTTDPRVVPTARKINRISYDEMLELASLGAKVLHSRSVELAKKYNIELQVLSSMEDTIGSNIPGTLVTKEEIIMEAPLVTGIAFTRNEAKITIKNVPDKPGMVAEIFAPISEANIVMDMIVQDTSTDGSVTAITFVLAQEKSQNAESLLKSMSVLQDSLIIMRTDMAKISVVGIGMRTHAAIAHQMFKSLAAEGINIDVISASELKTSVLVEQKYLDIAVRALHKAYNLDQESL